MGAKRRPGQIRASLQAKFDAANRAGDLARCIELADRLAALDGVDIVPEGQRPTSAADLETLLLAAATVADELGRADVRDLVLKAIELGTVAQGGPDGEVV